MTSLGDRLGFAVSAAREVEPGILEHFRSGNLRVERKADDSPVTEADRGAERALRERIAAAYPEDGILGEEFDEVPGASGVRWILDPIDGTKSFVAGVPLFGTLIGLEVEGEAAAGVIHLPAVDETVYAERGRTGWWRVGESEPRPAEVSGCDDLAEALFTTTSTAQMLEENAREAFLELVRTARVARGWGDAYGYALVATGRAEVMVDPRMNVWDAAPLLPVVEAAGGRFTDWSGAARIDGGSGVATNGRLHDLVLGILQGR